MKFKAKIRTTAAVNTNSPHPIWVLWSTQQGTEKRNKMELVKQLQSLLTQGDETLELKLSHWFGKSYELSGSYYTKELSIECVFRLEFNHDSSKVEFDVDVYGGYLPTSINNPHAFSHQVARASRLFEDFIRRLTSRLANRFQVNFRVEKLSAVAPLTPLRLRKKEFHGFRSISDRRPENLRDVTNSSSGMSDFELWLWYLYLSQDRPDIQVYNPETQAVEPNPFASGGGGDFAGGGATGSWETASVRVMSDARGEDTPTPAPLPPIYTAEPRDEAPHNKESSVIPPTDDWKPITESAPGWTPSWTSGREPEVCPRDDHSSPSPAPYYSPSPAPAPAPESNWTSSPPADSYSSSDSGDGGGDD